MPSDRDRAVRRALAIALGVNLATAALKIALGRAGDLLAVEADGFHSLSDGGGSLVALIGLAIARRPANEGHPYGHRRYELVAGALIGVSLLAVSWRVIEDAIEHAVSGTLHAPAPSVATFAVLGASLAVALALSSYQAAAGRRLRSALLTSDARHTRSDAIVTAGVIASSIGSFAGLPGLDIVAAVAVAALIGKAGLEIVWSNARLLADAAPLPAARVREVVDRFPLVRSIAVRTRGTPDAVFVDLRVAAPRSLRVSELDVLSSRIAIAIRERIEEVVDVMVHVEAEECRPSDGSPKARLERQPEEKDDERPSNPSLRRPRLRTSPWARLRTPARSTRRSLGLSRG
jgi:cation diffusion facilitator family transporter